MPSLTTVLLLVLLAAGFGAFAFRMVRRTVPPVSAPVRILLGSLRTVSMTLLSFVLLHPLLELVRHRTEKPAVALLLDVSQSMHTSDRGRVRGERAKEILRSEKVLSFGRRVDWFAFQFSDRVEPMAGGPPDSIRFDGAATDMAAAFEAMRGRFSGGALSGIVLVSDGAHNLGGDPVAAAEAAGVPVAAVCVGEPVKSANSRIARVVASDAAVADSAFEVEISVRSSGFEGREAAVSVTLEGKTLAESKVALPPDGMEASATLRVRTPSEPGLRTFRAGVSTVRGESNAADNTREFAVRILKRRTAVLLAAGAPVPDVGFFRRVLGGDQDFTLTVRTRAGASGFYEGPFPQTLDGTDVVVLLEAPGREFPEIAWRAISAGIRNRNLPFLLVSGGSADPVKLADLADRFPVRLRSQAAWNAVTPRLLPEGEDHPAMRVREGIEQNRVVWEHMPPAYSAWASVEPLPGCVQLALAVPPVATGSGRSAGNALIAEMRVRGGKAFAVFGQGLFRWSLLSRGLGEAWDAPETFLRNTVRWLAIAEKENPVRFVAPKPVLRAGEETTFTVEVRDGMFRPLTGADVRIRFPGSSGQAPLLLEETPGGMYQGAFRPGESGEAKAVAEAAKEGRKIGADTTAFKILPYAPELLDAEANPALVRAIAAATGGRMVPPDSLSLLPECFNLVSRRVTERREIDLLNRPLLLGLAVLLLTVEWIIRKRAGMA